MPLQTYSKHHNRQDVPEGICRASQQRGCTCRLTQSDTADGMHLQTYAKRHNRQDAHADIRRAAKQAKKIDRRTTKSKQQSYYSTDTGQTESSLRAITTLRPHMRHVRKLYIQSSPYSRHTGMGTLHKANNALRDRPDEPSRHALTRVCIAFASRPTARRAIVIPRMRRHTNSLHACPPADLHNDRPSELRSLCL